MLNYIVYEVNEDGFEDVVDQGEVALYEITDLVEDYPSWNGYSIVFEFNEKEV